MFLRLRAFDYSYFVGHVVCCSKIMNLHVIHGVTMLGFADSFGYDECP